MTIFNVSNSSQLMSALNQASGGDEIRLASGDYGELSLRNISFDSEVTITSANTSNPASFSELSLDSVSNLSFDSIVFDYTYSRGDVIFGSPFEIEDSSNIQITNSLFDGDVASGTGGEADGFGFARGLRIDNSSDIVVTNNEFTTWHRGLLVDSSENITFSGNEVHNIRSDGANFVEVRNVVVEDNYFHDFIGSPNSGDHRDMIQFFHAGAEFGSTDIVVRDNRFDVGEGSWAQTIFFGGSGTNLVYENVLIEDNVIFGSHVHGITLSETNGLVIQNNAVIPVTANSNLPGNTLSGGVTIPRINVEESSSNVTIINNISTQVNGFEGQRDWTLSNNAEPQSSNPNAPGYTGELLNSREAFNFEGTSLDTQQAEAPAPAPAPEPEEEQAEAPAPAPAPIPEPEEEQAEAPAPAPAPIPEPEEEQAEAPAPAPAPIPEPEEEQAEAPAPASGSDWEIDDYVLDVAGLAGTSDLKGNAAVTSAASGPSLTLSGRGDYADLGRLEEFEDADQITFSVDFAQSEADGGRSRLVWNHTKIGVEIVDDGLHVRVAREDGKWQNFKIDDLGLNDTDLHNATVVIDDEADRLQVVVDDQVVLDETDTNFELGSSSDFQHGWFLGSPWGRWFEGDISDFRIEQDALFVDPPIVDDAAIV